MVAGSLNIEAYGNPYETLRRSPIMVAPFPVGAFLQWEA